MAATTDLRSIADFVALPETNLSSLLDSPTTELIGKLLQNLEKKAKEYAQFKTQKVKLEVELETTVRTNESTIKSLKNTRDKALADIGKLRDDLQAAESSRAQAQSEVERIQQSIESDASDAAALRSRVTSLESSHRDTLLLLDSKSKEVDRLAQELTIEHQKLVEFRRQVTALEQAKQEASSAATSAKFRQASLEQELELQKKNVDWLENERQKKVEEHQKFRREKNARLHELQLALEQHIDQVDALRRSENALKSQISDQETRNSELVSEIQKIQERATADAESNRIEVDSLNRLVELQKNSAETAKTRVEELTASLDELKQDAADEIGRIRGEIQEEHNDREAAEQKVAELESRVAELEAELNEARTRPVTPRNDPNGQSPSTPVRQGTPLTSFTPRSTHRLRNGLSTTQLYEQYTFLEKELASERRKNELLEAQVDSMVQDLEENQPAIEELRSDQARLQAEVVEMSHLTDEAHTQRDAALKEAKILRGQLDALNRDLEITHQSNRDLASQIRRLMLEQHAGTISDLEYKALTDQIQAADRLDMEHLSSAQQEVNRHLVVFRNITELQENNQKQLATIRNLGDRLEQELAEDARSRCQELEKDLEAAQKRIAQYQDEIKHIVKQSQSFEKERELFRNVLTRRGQLPPQIDSADFSRSLPPTALGFSKSLQGDRTTSIAENDLSKLLSELQAQFDSYRQEASSDTRSLKSQISELSQRNTQLQADASRYLGQLTGATQRYEMLDANYKALKSERDDYQRRSHAAMEAATKQELRSQQTAEELVETKGIVDGLRRESANLKAEKDLWKTVEKRLIDDNESLRNERARLDQLNASLQNLLNEKEHSDSESRRRLQSQIESLETELQSAKRKLEEEMEDKKQMGLRRSYEQEQSQKRIDDLTTSLSGIREELASAKTARDLLQARVDEMTVELRSAEERLEVLTRPPSTPTPQTNGADNDALSREQELTVEISELKRDLELKSAELSRAEEHVEEYRGIAQSAEERLEQYQETSDNDKNDLQLSLDEKQQRVKELEQQIEEISAELIASNSELSKLREEQADATRKLEEQAAALQAEIERLKQSEKVAQDQAALNMTTTKAQAEIAERATQNYEAELVKHAEAAQNLRVVREDANRLRLELLEIKTQLENAKTDLQQKQTSWSEMEARYKQESLDLRSRREEVERHNKALHTSLETLNNQLKSLQQDRALPPGSQTEDSSQAEIIKHLRQEKEIVEVQYHLTTGELNRLKRQMESTQSQLDDARLKLDQQRRAELDFDKNAMNHNKLMETLNELNLHRESVVTLRSEKKQAEQASKEKSQRIEQLEQEIIPLRARIAEVENLVELKQGQIELLEKDRDHYQQRVHSILSRSEHVDPAELESLKTRNAELEARVVELESERDELVAEREALKTEVEGHPAATSAALDAQKKRLGEQFKTRDREMRQQKNDLQTELNTTKEQLAQVQSQLEASTAALSQQQEEVDARPSVEDQQEVGRQVEELQAKIQALEKSIMDKDAQISSYVTKEQGFENEKEQMKGRLNKRLAEVKREAEADKQAALSDLRSSLAATHEEELEKLRSQSVPISQEIQKSADVAGTSQTENETPLVDAQTMVEQLAKTMTTEQAKYLIRENETLRRIIQTNVKNKLEQLREQDAQPSNEDDEKKLEALRETVIREKDEEFIAERAKIIQEQQERFETEKQALIERMREEEQKKIDVEVKSAKEKTEQMLALKLKISKGNNDKAQAQLTVVKKAAAETPEKSVQEVWEVAKVAKPAPDGPKPGPAAAATAAATASALPQPSPADTKATPAKTNADGTPESNGTQGMAVTENGVTEEGEASSEPSQPSQAATIQAPPSSANRQSGIPQPASQLPRGGFRGRGNAPVGRGGIPRPGSAMSQNPNPAGRGRGNQGRGGANIAASPQGGAQGGLNPGAASFTPQGKRGREDGDEGGNMGKRIRGGGAGS